MTLDVRLQLMAATLAALEAEEQLGPPMDQLYNALVANGQQAKADALYQVLAGLRRNLTGAYALAMEVSATVAEEGTAAAAPTTEPAEEVASG